LDTNTFYRWEKQAREGMRAAFTTTRGSAESSAKDREIERLNAELVKKSRIIAEVIEDFLVAVLDGYSRYVVHWELLASMRAADVRLVIQHALEANDLSKVEVVMANGGQFTAADFKALVRQFELQHIRIRTYHPESNGTIERFHRSTRDALAGSELRNLSQARELIGTWVKHYNQERLHASLQYLPPAEYYTVRPDVRVAERKAKLEAAQQRRMEANRARLDQAA
jgi:putative transposase